MSEQNTAQKYDENDLIEGNISYTRLAGEISKEQNKQDEKHQEQLQNEPRPVLPQQLKGQQKGEGLILMHNSDGPNIQIFFSEGSKVKSAHIQSTQSKQKEEIGQANKRVYQSERHAPAPQIKQMVRSRLSSIQEQELQYKRSDDSLAEPQSPHGMLDSKIVVSRKLQSIFPMSNLKKSQINKRMAQSCRVQSPVIQPKLDEVFIRPIDDSQQIDLENHMQKNLQQDLQTLQIFPDTNQQIENLKKTEEGRAILSSLVTQSQQKQLTSPRQIQKQGLEDYRNGTNREGKIGQKLLLNKIEGLEKLIRELQERRRSPKDSTSKSHSVTIKNRIEAEPNKVQINKVNNVQMIKLVPNPLVSAEQYRDRWDRIAIFNLERIFHHQIWNSLARLCFFNDKNRQSYLLQILLFLNCNNKFQIVKSQQNQFIVQLSKGSIAILNSSSFFIGNCREKSHRIIKIKGLQINPNYYAYSGEFKADKKSGEGQILYKNNSSYSGSWSSDKYQGEGIFTSQLGDIYTGNFSYGMKSGRGKEVFQKGDQYHGQYLDNQFNGHGIYNWANGASYRGQFQSGMMHGNGSWVSKKGDSYIGQFFRNLKDGWGIYRWKSGKVYEGLFQNGYQVKPAEQFESKRNLIVIDHERLYQRSHQRPYERSHERQYGTKYQANFQRNVEINHERRSSLDSNPLKFNLKRSSKQYSQRSRFQCQKGGRHSLSNQNFRVYFR